MKGILLIMSGFSGAGKGTLLKKLLNEYDDYAFSVSMTTRAPRPGEQDGKDYFFVTKKEFEDNIEKGGFYEYASYCDNYYGTPKEYVDSCLNAGKSVILDIEVQGALQIKKKFPETVMVFVVPPSIKELRNRLKGRGTESDEVIDKRIHRAKEEFEFIKEYEYIVVNDDLDEAAKTLNSIVTAEKHKNNNTNQTVRLIEDELKSV